MTIYLYVKTHRKTGLKYLGKTEQDPQKYQGSGIKWRNHIKVHGYDVETQILRECQTNYEVQEWGLYYSRLWNIVESDQWANLIEETGTGFSSETANRYGKNGEVSKETQRNRVENGTHHFLGGEIARQANKKRVEDGTHPFLGGDVSRRVQKKRVENGTHNFLAGEISRQTQRRRVENGTHHWQDSEAARQKAIKRVEDGTHPFLGGDVQRQRVENGTHNFLGGEIQKQTQKKRINEGTHNFLTQWTCEHCGKQGANSTNYLRWHGNNCRSLSS